MFAVVLQLPYTKNMNSATQLTPGNLVKLVGVKAPVVVISKCPEGSDCYVVSGPRGEFMITDCGSHLVRWPEASGPFRNSSPRKCEIEWSVAMTAVAS